MGIAMGLKDAGAGFIEMTSDWNTPDPATEFAMVRRIMQASGRPLVFSLNQRHDRTEAWKDLLELSPRPRPMVCRSAASRRLGRSARCWG